jgi:uroporphyrinogen-III synthase
MIYLLSPLKKEGTLSLPMIEFSLLVNKIDFSSCDTLVFTSKQAVVSAENIDKKWKTYPTIAIGGATKKKIEELGGEVIYYPKEFYGEALAEDIKHFFSDRKLLYLRPKEVSFDSKTYLEKNGIAIEEQVIYETSCIRYNLDKQPKEYAIIIFTSPSTINCFFKNFDWHESYIAILIGHATKAHLPKMCKYVIADEPLIDACIKKAIEVEKKRVI